MEVTMDNLEQFLGTTFLHQNGVTRLRLAQADVKEGVVALDEEDRVNYRYNAAQAREQGDSEETIIQTILHAIQAIVDCKEGVLPYEKFALDTRVRQRPE